MADTDLQDKALEVDIARPLLKELEDGGLDLVLWGQAHHHLPPVLGQPTLDSHLFVK